MATGIGDLVARLGIDNSGFKKGLSSSRSLLSTFAGGIAGLVSPIGAAFAGIAGATGLGMLVKSSFEGVDSLSELGGTLNKSAAEMAGWAHAAKLSGLSMEDMTSGIRRFQKEGVDIFKFADQIAAIKDPAEQARRAMEVLGKSGGKFLPLLQGGSQAIREMVEEGSRLSGLEGLDATKVEEANDALDRARAAFAGIGNIIAVNVAPGIEWAAEKMQGFAEWVQSGKDSLSTMGEVSSGVMTAISVGLDNIGTVGELAFLSLELGLVQFGLSAWHLFTEQLPAGMAWLRDNWTDVIFSIGDYALTVFVNLGENLRSVMSEIWAYIKSGGSDAFEPMFKGLTEGVKSTIKEMPEIPERVVSELEKRLQENISELSEGLGEEFGKAQIAKGIADLEEQPSPNKAMPGFGDELEPKASKQSARTTLTAAFAGSREAASIMLRGVGGGADQIPKQQLGVQQQILIATKANRPPTLTPLTLGT